jgi:hypothetical protein
MAPTPSRAQPDTYDGAAKGAVRRAELHDQTGRLIGHVWTDGRNAAGFTTSPDTDPTAVRAGAKIWRIIADAYQRGVPAAALLDPALFRPYQLKTTA